MHCVLIISLVSITQLSAGCSADTVRQGGDAGAASTDLSGDSPDLTPGPPGCDGTICDGVCLGTASDRLNCGGCGVVCKTNQSCALGVCIGGDDWQWAADWVVLPSATTDFSIDLNGDGVPDNRLVALRNALSGYGIDLAGEINNILGAGEVAVLFDIPPDADLTSPVSIFSALPFTPVFGNMPVLRVDWNAGVSTYTGARPTGATDFVGVAKAGPLPSPVTIKIRSTDLPGATFSIPLRVHRVHHAYGYRDSQGYTHPVTIDAANRTVGEFQGSIRKLDIDAFIATLAQYMTQMLASKDPALKKYQVQIGIFDNGGCTNPDGTMAQDSDSRIDPCELTATQAVRAGIAPDIKVYDENGHFAPDGLQGKPDSLSFGFRFYTVAEKFR